MVDKSGKIISKGRIVSTTTGAAKGIAYAPIILLEAAHMISAHDQIKQLRILDEKMSKLIRKHDIALTAELKSIFRHAKEIIQHSTELSDHDRSELSTISKQLMKLREQWRADFLDDLQQIKPVKPSLLSKLKTKPARYKSMIKVNQSRVESAVQSLKKVYLMHVSIILQMEISKHTGRLETFTGVTLQDEREEWETLSKQTKLAVDEITKDFNSPSTWLPITNSIDSFHKAWSFKDEVNDAIETDVQEC